MTVKVETSTQAKQRLKERLKNQTAKGSQGEITYTRSQILSSHDDETIVKIGERQVNGDTKPVTVKVEGDEYIGDAVKRELGKHARKQWQKSLRQRNA